MRRLVFPALFVLLISLPSTSHAFGLLKYIGDAISNQLGLDRGPVVKVWPACPPVPGSGVMGDPRLTPYIPNPQLQADGF